MRFLGSFENNIKLTRKSADEKQYKNLLVSGQHDYVETDWGFMVFNGELYSEHSMNMPFTDILLKQIQEKGIESVGELAGKFIAIILHNDRLFIFRDITGLQSAVYYNTELYGNSIEMIQESGIFNLEPDKSSFSMFLKNGFIPSPYTPFKNLRKLSPFQFLDFSKGRLSVHDMLKFENYLQTASTSTLSADEAAAKYEQLHERSIRNRIQNKNNIAVLLSGGYDSGGNLSALRKIYKGEIHAYSVGFNDSDWSELPLAAIMAEKFGAELTQIILDGSEIEDLPKIISAFEEPFFENGLFVNYKIAAVIDPAKTDILIGGDGNDQVFGTSGREVALHYLSGKTGFRLVQKLLRPLLNKLPRLSRLAFHNESVLNALESQHFGFSDREIKSLFTGQPAKAISTQVKVRNRTFDQIYLWRNYHTDIKKTCLQVIGHKATRLTSSRNLNIALPYLDNQILQFLSSLPVNYKINGSLKDLILGKGKSKYILKKYLHDKLPEAITNRKKQGGFAPLGMFLKDASLRNKIYQFVNQTLEKIGFFNMDYLQTQMKQIEKTISNQDEWFWQKQKQESRLMFLLVLSLWWNYYMEKNRNAFLSEYLNDKKYHQIQDMQVRTRTEDLSRP
jgi:asparagine synthase (glutamine-hydrolysing)